MTPKLSQKEQMAYSTIARLEAERDHLQRDLTARDEELAHCESMATMVEEREWAEHVGTGAVSSKVEAAFTQLHNELQEAQGKLAEAHALLRDTKSMLASELSYELFKKMAEHMKRIDTALSASAEPSAPYVQIPEGYCVMPRRLTAENGAKALLLGEFKLEVTHECPECAELEEPTEGCEICDGAGEYGQRHTIPWDQIKFIYSQAVKGLALKL